MTVETDFSKLNAARRPKFLRKAPVTWKRLRCRVTAGRENAKNERPKGFVYRLMVERDSRDGKVKAGQVYAWIPESKLHARRTK